MIRVTVLSLVLLAATPALAEIRLGSGQSTGGPARDQLSETGGVRRAAPPMVAASRTARTGRDRMRSSQAAPTAPASSGLPHYYSGQRAGGPLSR